MNTSTFLILSAAVGVVGIVVIINPEIILPVNFYAVFPISGATGVLGGIIAWMGIKQRQENIGLASRVAIIFSGFIISLIGIGLLLLILSFYGFTK